MDELTLYTKILGLTHPWTVTDIRFVESEKAVHVRVEIDEDEPLCCPSCGNQKTCRRSLTRALHPIKKTSLK